VLDGSSITSSGGSADHDTKLDSLLDILLPHPRLSKAVSDANNKNMALFADSNGTLSDQRTALMEDMMEVGMVKQASRVVWLCYVSLSERLFQGC